MILKIGKPFICENKDDSVVLSAEINAEFWSKPKIIWYKVDGEYSKYLCEERADAFLIALLPLAFSRSKKDDKLVIKCDAPVSEQLFYQLTRHYIPAWSKYVEWMNEFEIDAELSNKCLNIKNSVGCGISGGIDSYYSLLKSLEFDSANYKVTHGLYCETGDLGEFDNEKQTAYREMSKKICDECGIKFVDIKSNLCGEIYDFVHEICVTNIFISYAYALQKLFSVYYFSASHIYGTFEFSDYSSEYNAIFNMHCLENENLHLYVTGADAIRHEKTEYISRKKIPQKYLMVCRKPYVEDGILKNCSRCSKCTRTMIDLELAGNLKAFNNVFDVDAYYRDPAYYWGYLFYKGTKDAFIKETLTLAKKKKIKIPISYRIAGIKKIITNKGKRGNILQKSYRP